MQSRTIRPKGGNDPAFGCRASWDALVVPALWVQSGSTAGSQPDQFEMLN
jgi:hypothetical protein